MNVVRCDSKEDLARRAAADGADRIRAAVRERGGANIIVATGLSQARMLQHLLEARDVDWGRVTGFHLDEYIGVTASHPASFRRYLRERFVDHLPLKAFHYINGEPEPAGECRRVGGLLRAHPVDVAFVGIGENGHLAFNDPPADFEVDEPYIVVKLDEACRRQQVGEGWFRDLSEVPARAISMSIRQIMKSRAILCSVPDARKADAVRECVQGPVTPDRPASILQRHTQATIYLDPDSARELS